jgi:hypothetical protein
MERLMADNANLHRVEITFQGNLIKAHYKQPHAIWQKRGGGDPRGGGPRGAVRSFSRASRKRLIELFATLKGGEKAVMITLTYGQHWPSPSASKDHLRTFLQRIRRRWPHVSAIWRLEFQRRGAPHYHIILFNIPFLPKQDVAAAWHSVIGDEYADWSQGDPRAPFTRIEAIKSRRRLIAYVSKYVAKSDEDESHQPAPPPQESNTGLDHAAYLHSGRFWGVMNREALPYAAKVVIGLLMDERGERAFWTMRRYAKRYFSGIPVWRKQGWSVFGDSRQWYRLYKHTCAQVIG